MKVTQQKIKRRVPWGALLAGSLLLVPTLPTFADKPVTQQSTSSARPSAPPRASAPSRPSAPPRSSASRPSSGSRSGGSRSSASRPSAPRRSDSGGSSTRSRAPQIRNGGPDRVIPKQRPKVDPILRRDKGDEIPNTAKRQDGDRHRGKYRHYDGYRNYGGYYYGCRDPYYPGCGYRRFHSYGVPYYFYGPYGYYYRHFPTYGGYGSGAYGSGGVGGGAAYGGGAEMGALDMDVRPEEAQIFVNGEYVGIADQYDGYPGYLWLEEGTYDVVIFMEGFQTISRQYSVYPGLVVDVNDRMARGEAKRPEELISKSTVNRDERLRRDRERAEAVARDRERDQQMGVGRIQLKIWPEDTAVYLDGHFLGTAGELAQLSAGLVVEPGEHVLELVRPGFITEEVPIDVPSGEIIDIQKELQSR